MIKDNTYTTTHLNNADMPASPVLHTIDGNWVKEPIDEYLGLTKREYFAAMAMQGLLSNDDEMGYSKNDAAELLGIDKEDYDWKTHWPQLVAVKAVQHTDALLKELSK